MNIMKKFGLIFCCLSMLVLVGCGVKERQGCVTVYFEKEMTVEQKAELRQQLQEHSVVLNIKYISSEEALETFEEDYLVGDGDLLGMLGINPLENSENFQIIVAGTKTDIEKFVELTRKTEGVRKVHGVLYEYLE